MIENKKKKKKHQWFHKGEESKKQDPNAKRKSTCIHFAVWLLMRERFLEFEGRLKGWWWSKDLKRFESRRWAPRFLHIDIVAEERKRGAQAPPRVIYSTLMYACFIEFYGTHPGATLIRLPHLYTLPRELDLISSDLGQ